MMPMNAKANKEKKHCHGKDEAYQLMPFTTVSPLFLYRASPLDR